ncbi:nicotinate phosphoribosyltransferase [Nannocystis punicea]|uniref:Nicotinate phosphoribosyltransferase n=1 Tax=Nannocystis punicea TaxID=2995304 RepID=A0ABY7HCL4_9BACT|nr:nicotinate phosphoribosyltransferase [Nannocystis poenicansa]WAS97003.1 nicotinate phosphoribosyltransferase [Nannocystis poenicansa]
MSPGSLALLTDLYQVTMACGYWKLGRADEEAVFNLFFRRAPFRGAHAIAAGLQEALQYMAEFRFTPEDVAYLGTLRGNDGQRLLEPGFLDYLASLRLSLDVEAVPEGTPVFPHEPLLRVRGPLAQCQLLETPLLNFINFSTLIATKAARICEAAGGEPVVEFGLRRAQGSDGALTASRAAYIGGCAATSNVLAGMRHGIPVRGTHAHSWVMSFADEREAFAAYAEALPNNCTFLVDTYDTLEGVRRAAEVGKQLAARGHAMAGVRLDSGDLAALSVAAREILDAAGLEQAAIVASNDLDEREIAALKAKGAAIGVWGVGTRLVTAYDQPALGGVYKLAALRGREGWEYRIKLSEEPVKVSNPGVQQVRRFADPAGRLLGDLIYEEGLGLHGAGVRVDAAGEFAPPAGASVEDLLVPVLRAGRQVYEPPPLAEVRARTQAQLQRLDPAVRRIEAPATYPVALDRPLADLKARLMAEARRER